VSQQTPHSFGRTSEFVLFTTTCPLLVRGSTPRQDEAVSAFSNE
jgi:hypothetical protein